MPNEASLRKSESEISSFLPNKHSSIDGGGGGDFFVFMPADIVY
jgi:hypothetical protein